MFYFITTVNLDDRILEAGAKMMPIDVSVKILTTQPANRQMIIIY